MEILSKLNKNQLEAALHTDGPLLILAGAGSGKTRVITSRIAYLIKEKNVFPGNIFAVTFTNKAAEEMKKRVIEIAGPAGNSVFIKTFHSASVYILRRFGDKIGIPNNFSIYDSDDQENVIKEILVEMKLDPKKIKPSMIASKISEVKDKAELLEGTDISLLVPDYHSFNFQEIYTQYHESLKRNNALDFNDLLIKTVVLLKTRPDALAELQRRWKYFMIDEYQDTNYSQYLIAKYLASSSKNICVVGDDDQSIYSWRGADIRNILNFEKDYPDAKVITLEENYRSTEPIIAAAAGVIKNNEVRKKKNVRSIKGDGENLIWCTSNNEYGEAEYVTNVIVSLKLKERMKNRDFAIFYRTNAQSRVFEEMLRKENIPYRLIGGLKFYDRREIKDLLSYLRFIVNHYDTVSMARIINAPSRGIGKASLDKLKEAAAAHNVSEWEIIEKNLFPGKEPKGFEEFRKIINSAKAGLGQIPESIKLSKFVSNVVEISGYKKSLEEDKTQESASRIENIDELVNSVFEYETSNPEADISQFLQDISLVTSEENPDGTGSDPSNSVTLMTVHNAKGLEFHVVFITGMEENTFPHRFSIDSPEAIEEERRLCYVAITRAMDRCFLTSADLRRSYAGVDYKQPSRFLFEIPAELVEQKKYIRDDSRSAYSFGAPQAPKQPVRTDTRYEREKQAAILPKKEPVASDSRFKEKEAVLHPKYGQGRILHIEGSGDNVKLTINFSSGTKVFMEKYTPLERLG